MNKRENIVLVGFMGAGKSSVARQVAKSLKTKLVDTDLLIEERVGMRINEIFMKKGEPFFRDLETEVLEELSAIQNRSMVISLGGGTPLKEENQSIIQQLGYVVWLSTTAETTYKRLKENGDRPLLKVPDPMATIKSLLIEREPVYRKVSQIEIKTEELSISEISNGIIDSASYYFSAL